MTRWRAPLVSGLVAVLALGGVAHAQGTGDRMDAKALVQTGVKLLESGNYLGALAIFKDAYARFPSAKILLNIGTTLRLLGRNADAANAYQRYIDSPDADPARKIEVGEALADLDKALGRLEIKVTPTDAEVMITDEWIPAPTAKLWRVEPGTVTVKARRGFYEPGAQTTTVAAAATQSISIDLVKVPEPKQTMIETPVDVDEGPRSRIGAMAMVHVSVVPKLGSAGRVGATVDLTSQLAVDAALLLGPGLVSDGMATLEPPSFGGYLGASFAFLPGKLRPRAAAGLPIFASDGARFFVRGAGGIEYVASRHISLALEVGAEIALNPENDIRDLAVVPALGVSGRL